MLQEVLSYSESLHPTFDLWDINQLVTGVYAGMQDDFKHTGISFELNLGSNLPPVRVDYKQLSYCLRSILNNALEAMPGGGAIEIATRRADDQLQIILRDNGAGMSPETLRSITAPFFSTKDQGSGLGLSLCARILEGHGAELEVESREGAGTTFTIRLKITQGGTT